jgi:hypothetical protein
LCGGARMNLESGGAREQIPAATDGLAAIEP